MSSVTCRKSSNVERLQSYDEYGSFTPLGIRSRRRGGFLLYARATAISMEACEEVEAVRAEVLHFLLLCSPDPMHVAMYILALISFFSFLFVVRSSFHNLGK